MIPQHLSKTNEHYTPSHVVEAARNVLGGIDLDPASCAEANKTVQAKRFIGLPRDGLQSDWYGRVFLNPPGGTFTLTSRQQADLGLSDSSAKLFRQSLAAESLRWGTKSRACAWWRKLCEEHESGMVTAAIFVGFTLEILRTAQGNDKWPDPLRFPLCVPRDRLCFGGDQPSHANVIVYLGPDTETFQREFSPIGQVKL